MTTTAMPEQSFERSSRMKKSLGNKPLVYPQPVLVVATYNKDGTPNAMTAAWGCVCDYSKIMVVIDRSHKTTENILGRGAFTVSIADSGHIVQADYLGIVSGRDVPDKVGRAALAHTRSEAVDAPVLEDFPLTLECRLSDYDEATERVTGEVVNTLADESILSGGKIDMAKFRPVTYDGQNHDYIALGGKVGKAFSDGKRLGA